MGNQLSPLLRLAIPLVLVYIAFSVLGPIWGIVSMVLLIALVVFFNRTIIYQNTANKKYLKGDFDGALNDLKRAVSLSPKLPGVRGTYAYLLLKLGYTQEAAVQIEEALNNARTDTEKNQLTLTKSMVLWKQDKTDEAISSLEELIKDFENTNVYATLGFLYIEKGDMEKALEFNLKAVDFNDTNGIILDNLGTVYYNIREYEKAREIYQKLMKLKPVFPEAFYNYARVLDKLGDLEKALYMTRHSLTLRFWNISTIKKEEVESFLEELEKRAQDISLDNSEQSEALKNDDTNYDQDNSEQNSAQDKQEEKN
ncbi:MAG: tetratricopeptide repeat protein [Clostridiaceae bacterium]|nr:tetratricopeptide repeat protein [Clostridiaceae bacterium]